MQIRVLSDIHIDINENYPIPSFEDDIFTIVAGDISGDPVISSYWIEDNIKNGLFVHGNHDLVYNKLEQPLQEQKLIFKNKFPLDANVSYLDNQYKIVNDIYSPSYVDKDSLVIPNVDIYAITTIFCAVCMLLTSGFVFAFALSRFVNCLYGALTSPVIRLDSSPLISSLRR